MREFLQKQKIGSPTFFLMHNTEAAASGDLFHLIYCVMSNSKQEVLTQPQKLELEECLRYLVIGGQLPYEMYVQITDGFDFRHMGSYIGFSGIYGDEIKIILPEKDVDELEKKKLV